MIDEKSLSLYARLMPAYRRSRCAHKTRGAPALPRRALPYLQCVDARACAYRVAPEAKSPPKGATIEAKLPRNSPWICRGAAQTHACAP
eukprot:657843-Pleurochrysis_carterae.AAC.2